MEDDEVSALTRLSIDPGRFSTEGGPPSPSQAQTRDAFGFKWGQRHSYESRPVKDATREWLFQRYCGGDPSRLDGWLAGGRRIILDAGCGSGFSSLLFFGDRLRGHDYLGVDISDSVVVARTRFRECGCPGDFLKCDIMDLPVPGGSVDIIFSEGVLHHTDSTERAIKRLAPLLVPGGRFLFYVYARKAVVREFTDDHVREFLAGLTDEEAWKALYPLTKLGIALGELSTEVEVPEDVPLLGIKKGRINLQRFFYWNVCKLFYRSDWTFEEMNHVNFDWFRPRNCHRQTPEEVEAWVREAGLGVERMDVQEAGITVVARREG